MFANLSLALSPDFVNSAVKILVTRLLPLNVQDLQAWMADPEEWINTEDKENDQWEYELRVCHFFPRMTIRLPKAQACSERVLIHFSNQFPGYVVPLLQTMFNEIAGLSTTLLEILNRHYLPDELGQIAPDFPALIQKEALYCALGRCSIRLHDAIPFEQWASGTLVTEAQSRDSK